ncbi:MAG TPA: DUF2147 domain-containing protein [Chitinophagaceae bacterium]
MKKLFFGLLTVCVSFISSFAQNADAAKGVWLNEDQDAKVEIFRSGDKYFGKIVWTKDMYAADGKTLKKDSNNPDDNLKNRPIRDMVIITDLVYDDGEWTGGKLYDPKSGKTYKAKMKIKGGNLEIRGYVGSPMLGKTTVWTRAS